MGTLRVLELLLGRYLSMRTRSEKEVRSYLARKASKLPVEQVQIDQLIEKYSNLGYIDDAKFAEVMSHSTVVNKAKGKRVLQIKLQQAGVDKSLIEQTLREIDPQETIAAMEKRLQKYTSKLQKLDPRESRMKAYSYLLAAGFSSNEIRPFLDEWNEKK